MKPGAPWQYCINIGWVLTGLSPARQLARPPSQVAVRCTVFSMQLCQAVQSAASSSACPRIKGNAEATKPCTASI